MSTAGGIDILIPVWRRAQNARPVHESIAQNTTVPHTITFLASEDDHEEINAVAVLMPSYHWVLPPLAHSDYSVKINFGYRQGDHPFVFTAADDIEFTPGWDEEILRVAERTGAGVVGSNDDANPLVKRGRHSTHTLFRREYVDTVGATFFDGPGIVFHSGYFHQWCDTECVKAAMDRGEWAFARRSVVRHHHPFYDKTVRMDDTYRRALGDASHDSALYKQRLQAWTRQRRTTVI